jgi:hypothetical protein
MLQLKQLVWAAGNAGIQHGTEKAASGCHPAQTMSLLQSCQSCCIDQGHVGHAWCAQHAHLLEDLSTKVQVGLQHQTDTAPSVVRTHDHTYGLLAAHAAWRVCTDCHPVGSHHCRSQPMGSGHAHAQQSCGARSEQVAATVKLETVEQMVKRCAGSTCRTALRPEWAECKLTMSPQHQRLLL